MSPARKVTVYDPTADPKSTGVTLAPRLDTFKGKRVGILDNGKPNAGFLMLVSKYRVVDDPASMVPIVESPDAISIIVVGGAGKHSSWQAGDARDQAPVARGTVSV